jgi:mRNA-degrading endonuclease RelE of RelBE toxin-antitoxin system
MYTLKIHKKAVKFFKSRSISERGLIKIKLDFLTENPYSHPQLISAGVRGDVYKKQ